MKAPSTPARFHTPVKHYHRSKQAHNGDWEGWIDNDTARKKKKPLNKIAIAAGILILGMISVGTLLYFQGF